MTTGSILLTIALLIVLLLYVVRPFFASTTITEQQTSRQKLLAQKDSLLEQIHTLDFYHTTGKLPDDVYDPQRAHLVREAAVVLQKLEATTMDSVDDVETAIETAVARLRHSPPQTPTRTVKTPNPGGYCSQCGEPIAADDNFCAVCGHKVREAVNV
jgi:hypothetical protein